MKLIGWKFFALGNDLQKHYAVTVHNRFQTLMNDTSDLPREKKYNNLIIADNEVAPDILPKKRYFWQQQQHPKRKRGTGNGSCAKFSMTY